jgi:hypothetical protein
MGLAHLTTASEPGLGPVTRAAVPATRREEVLEMRNRLLLWLPILTALALAALGAMDWGP